MQPRSNIARNRNKLCSICERFKFVEKNSQF